MQFFSGLFLRVSWLITEVEDMIDIKFETIVGIAKIGANVALRAQLALVLLHDRLVLEEEHCAERRLIVAW